MERTGQRERDRKDEKGRTRKEEWERRNEKEKTERERRKKRIIGNNEKQFKTTESSGR